MLNYKGLALLVATAGVALALVVGSLLRLLLQEPEESQARRLVRLWAAALCGWGAASVVYGRLFSAFVSWFGDCAWDARFALLALAAGGTAAASLTSWRHVRGKARPGRFSLYLMLLVALNWLLVADLIEIAHEHYK